ncbi:bifunctional isochorismate lyase / aryl carrier protein [Thermoactinomyces sp. DSM 45891]|nr:bifunctional isochorismate lyase / aryl carrier protein [Thermoactinomyces sp. DSM 45891]
MGIPLITPYAMPIETDLPENKVVWEADPKRAVLLIHDMQKYFMRPYQVGQSPIVELMKHIGSLKETCKEFAIPVVYSAQPGDQSPEDRALLIDFWGPGMTEDPLQTQIVDELSPEKNDRVLTKWRYSAFQRTDLLEYMQEQGRDQLIICGVYAHIGCLLTACDAFMKDVQSFFVADAVADFSLQDHQMAIHYAASRCAYTITTDQIVEQLKKEQYSYDV